MTIEDSNLWPIILVDIKHGRRCRTYAVWGPCFMCKNWTIDIQVSAHHFGVEEVLMVDEACREHLGECALAGVGSVS